MSRIQWTIAAAPVTADAADTVEIHGRIVHQLAEAHDIQLGVAAVLIRPMLGDLIRSGISECRRDNGQYRLSEGDCHSFAWHATGTAHSSIKDYEASHADAECPAPQPLLEVPAATWLPHFRDSGHPPQGSAQPWRQVLRTASQLPVTLFRPALHYFALHRFHISAIRPDMLATVFFAMATEARLVHEKWNGLPGKAFIPDGTGLIWQLSSHCVGSDKPAITGVLPPSARSADRPGLQRARRVPTSPYLASQRRPY
ncbi:hypothetical protein OG742_30470 [Streptomyces sp. NBC_00828]|uniref:hypothetical protein n=1 Tax=Streptomyces sp. NBC_00828 TaxID=2903678 RepID=UPI0038676DE5